MVFNLVFCIFLSYCLTYHIIKITDDVINITADVTGCVLDVLQVNCDFQIKLGSLAHLDSHILTITMILAMLDQMIKTYYLAGFTYISDNLEKLSIISNIKQLDLKGYFHYIIFFLIWLPWQSYYIRGRQDSKNWFFSPVKIYQIS